MVEKITRTLNAGPGGALFDFGKDAFARLEVELAGRGGETVTLAIGEVLKNGRLDPEPGGFRCYKKMERVLKTGTNRFFFEIPDHVSPYPASDPFKCHPPAECGGEIAPFRYAQIDRYTGPCTVTRHAFFGKFNEDDAHFECSDERLNRIWELCKYTMKATSVFGKFVDGERERLPYEGDTYINQLGYFSCTNDWKIAHDTLDYLMERSTWPTEWRLIMPTLVRDYYLYSGDRGSVECWKNGLEDKLLPELAGGDGLIRGNEKIRDIVDWPPAERDGYEFGEVNCVPNCYYHGALLAMHELYGEGEYLRKAAAVRKGIRSAMLKKGLFVDNPKSQHTSLHTAVFALRFGLAEKEEVPGLIEIIKSKGMACSVYVAQFLLETCYMNREAEYALSLMTADTLRSWQNMLDKGSTITMEAWDDSFKPNQDWNHAWGAAPAAVIPRHLCGIRPLEAGFRRFIADPQAASLKYGKFRQKTACGTISLEWDGDKQILTVPDGAEAVYRGKTLPPGTHVL